MTFHEGGDGRRIERQRRALVIEEEIAEPQRQVAFIEFNAGIPGGGDDAPPVRIGAEDRGLDQGTVRHGGGDGRASTSVRQPSTWRVTRCAAPSASSAMARANS